MEIKICSTCKEEKQLSEFGKDKNSKDSKNHICKICVNISSANYRKNNPEKRKETTKTYRENNREKCNIATVKCHRENPEKLLEYNAKYRAENPEKRKITCNNWYKNNKEEIKVKSKIWKSENPEKVSSYSSNRRSIKRNAEGSHTAEDIIRLLSLQKHKCPICKISIKENYHVDHVIPLSKGGGNGVNNLQILCPKCNLQKHAKDPIDFMREKGFLL